MVERRAERLCGSRAPFVLIVLLAFASSFVACHRRSEGTLRATLADLKPVHAGVSVDGERVSWLRRVGRGALVVTDGEGRARLRLDDGTSIVMDRDARARVEESGVVLDAGRVHVTSPAGTRSEVRVGDARMLMSGAVAGVERRADAISIYAADGELSVFALGKEQRVRSGETARIGNGQVIVAPERVYEDWTHGLARPWAARGAPRRAVGELWGVDRSKPAGSGASPLTIRSQRVTAAIDREQARTSSVTTFFNGGSERVDGDFRFALPPGAFVSSFSVTRNGSREVAHIALASRTRFGETQSGGVLEWAGDGWLRGRLADVEPGQELSVTVEYGEWLSPRPLGNNSAVQYRYPLVGAGEAPLIGDFSARVDASASSPLSLGAGYGARNDGRAVVLARSDFRPAADFVVDVEQRRIQSPARLYIAPPDDAQPDAGSVVMLRTELPVSKPSDGVSLALVLDSSGSVEPALLEVERALVEALLAGLGAHDRVVVFAADQALRPLGPKTLGVLDAARRKAISAALGTVSPGGASDLGLALEGAADALPSDTVGGMVIYVGDGWATLGETKAEDILSRLARRPSGAPRLGAVALGPLANRRLLSALTRGSGPLLEVMDTADAAQTSIELMSDALRPALVGVEVDFGPEVEQVYPRRARVVSAGETFTAVGRLRGKPPATVKLRYRDASGGHEEVRALELLSATEPDDLRRRWAAERVEEIVVDGKGREAATDVAMRAALITPWTALSVNGGAEYEPSQLEARALDLALDGANVVGAVIASATQPNGTLEASGEPAATSPDLKDALGAAVRRVIDAAAPAVRACRDSRVALRPELAGSLDVSLEVDGDGLPHDVEVRGATPSAEDRALDRCVQLVIEGLRFPATQQTARVKVAHALFLPPAPRSLGARTCSPISKLPLPLRRGAWWARLQRTVASDVYRDAKRQCELPTWTDRRALLELCLSLFTAGVGRIKLAQQLDALGEADAAALVRREAVRRAQSPAELSAVRAALLGDERYPGTVFEERYRAARDDAQRLEVVTRFLALAPHDSRLRRRQVALLEALGKKSELIELTRSLLSDPLADTLLLCDAASALHRAGFDDEARRSYGELAERAPRDPWVRALLGDRLRAEGWFDDASAAYAVLTDLVPDDARALLRAALAHAGAGRLDIAQRLLTRVAQTGGRAADAGLGELARALGRALAGEAASSASEGEVARLRRVALDLSQAEASHWLLLRAEPGAPELDLALQRGAGATKESLEPDVAASSLGLYLYKVSSDADPLLSYRLRASRPQELPPSRGTALTVEVLSPRPGAPLRREVLTLPSDGKAIELGAR